MFCAEIPVVARRIENRVAAGAILRATIFRADVAVVAGQGGSDALTLATCIAAEARVSIVTAVCIIFEDTPMGDHAEIIRARIAVITG